jgi:beta-phosphoglucomutase
MKSTLSIKDEKFVEDIQLVIFDLDGVIVDSEPLHDAAKHAILDHLGIQKDVDFSRSVGYPLHELWLKFIKEYNLSQSPAELERMQYDFIIGQMRERQIPLSNGLTDVLKQLRQQDIRLAVSSSSNRYYVDRVLEYYQLSDWFEATVGGDEVPEKKPAPDGYLRALELAGVPASAAVAIEDSEAGSLSAKAAGITCIGYRNPTSGEQNLASVDMIINSLSEISTIILKG